jgi:hypothetical protein
MDEKYLSELKSDVSLGRWDKVIINEDAVTVTSNQGEGLQEKPIMYDISEKDLQSVCVRLE